MSNALTAGSAYERLPRRHKRFVDHYVSGAKASDAIVAAGCKSVRPRNLAARLLQKDEIQAAVEERTKFFLQDTAARTHRTMEKVVAIAYCDPRKVVDPETGKAVPLERMDADTAAAISSVEVENISINGETGTRYKYRFWDKNKALEKLGQWQKLWDGPGTRINVDARSAHVHQHVGSEDAVRSVADLGGRIAALTASLGASASGADGSVLPAQVRDGPAGRGTPVDAGENP